MPVYHQIQSRTQLADYCFRKLGKPVINIEVSPDQADDRIQEAFQTYAEKHYDATEETWVAYQITQEDIDNNYITVPEDIVSIVDIQPFSNLFGDSGDMFSYRYQIAREALSPWQAFDMTSYYMKVTNYYTTMDMITPEPGYDFTRHMNKLKLADNMQDFEVGEYIGIRVYRLINPDDYVSVYNDKWLKEYATALIMKQWGQNLSKFTNVQMLGGDTINGEQIYQNALNEIERLEEELETTYQEPPMFFVG